MRASLVLVISLVVLSLILVANAELRGCVNSRRSLPHGSTTDESRLNNKHTAQTRDEPRGHEHQVRNGREKCSFIQTSANRRPNFIIFLADDLGYGDISSFGSPDIITPNIDELVHNGLKMTHHYSAPMCTPTRAAILTGRDLIRTGMYNPQTFLNEDSAFKTPPPVFYPPSYGMLPASEILLPELLRDVGYTSALFGKWHLGSINDTALPLQRGFDRYWGMPYSSDMGCPPGVGYPCLNTAGPAATWKAVPLYDGNVIIEQPTTFDDFLPRMIEQAIDFMEDAHREKKPFMVNFNWVSPHLPLFTAPEFVGVSTRGKFGDTVVEIDASVGRIMAALERLNIDEDTLVIFTSDNGPSNYFQAGGGSAGPFSGGKGQTLEGGIRVPSIWHWPGKIPPKSVDTSITSVADIFTTLASIAGAEIPLDRPIDGLDLSEVLFEGGDSGRECMAFYVQSQLTAARCGNYKMHWMLMPNIVSVPVPLATPLLYNVRTDPLEKFALNLTAPNFAPFVAQIEAFKAQYLAELVPGPPQFQLYDLSPDAYQPCCNQATNCICLRPGVSLSRAVDYDPQAEAEMVQTLASFGVPAIGESGYFFD